MCLNKNNKKKDFARFCQKLIGYVNSELSQKKILIAPAKMDIVPAKLVDFEPSANTVKIDKFSGLR